MTFARHRYIAKRADEPERMLLRVCRLFLSDIMLMEHGLTSAEYLCIICNICCTTLVFLQKGMDRMPRKFMFTREEIISAALKLIRKSGVSALTARALGTELGSSSRPVFGLFKNMEEVQQEVLKAADKLYQSYLKKDMENGKYPPYKASGMAYIRFAKEEKELFKLLFMRDRTDENTEEDREKIKPLLCLIQQNLGLNEEDAFMFHTEMWLYAHGMATALATSYLVWNEEFISRALTDGYEGMKIRYEKGKSYDS